MSLTKELAHELRTVTSQPSDVAVMPQWSKVIPIAFYAAFGYFILMFGYNTFQMNLQDANKAELSRIVSQYNEMIQTDQTTMKRLIQQRNGAVRVARWVDYNPQVQPLLMGIYGGLDDRLQISLLKLERRSGVTPEYTMSFSFRSEQSDSNPMIEAVRVGLAKQSWQVITNLQTYGAQDGTTDFQAYLQPQPSAMKFESQYLPITQEPGAPTQPTGVAK